MIVLLAEKEAKKKIYCVKNEGIVPFFKKEKKKRVRERVRTNKGRTQEECYYNNKLRK
jgi:hypothetical protein